MTRMGIRAAAIALAGISLTAAMAMAAEPSASLKQGKPDLKSAGPLAFGPEGILFVGDTQGRRTLRHRHGRKGRQGHREAEAPGQGPGRQDRRPARDRRQAGPDQRPGGQSAVGHRVCLGGSRTRARSDPRDRPDQRRREARGAGPGQRPVRQGRGPQRPATGPARGGLGPSRSPTWPMWTVASSWRACRTRNSRPD